MSAARRGCDRRFSLQALNPLGYTSGFEQLLKNRLVSTGLANANWRTLLPPSVGQIQGE